MVPFAVVVHASSMLQYLVLWLQEVYISVLVLQGNIIHLMR